MPLNRKIYTFKNKAPTSKLISDPICLRDEDQVFQDDPVVNQAFEMAGLVYDFFKTRFNRDSYDNQGRCLEVYVHSTKPMGTANFHHTVQYDYLIVGNANQEFDNPVNHLDTIAHEFAHGYVHYLFPVPYRKAQGAIIEHLCDIFGVCIRQDVIGDYDNWVLGKNYTLQKAGLRDLEQPANPEVLIPMLDHVPNSFDYSSHSSFYQYSGFLSSAFVKAAKTLGSWEDLLTIWYESLANLNKKSKYHDFAQAIRNTAQNYDSPIYDSVDEGFRRVGL